MIEFKNVNKDFKIKLRTKLKVLNGLNFKINPGDRIALIGKNGVGKSTSINILLKILYPNSGEILVDSNKINYNGEIGVQFQKEDFPRNSRVMDVIWTYATIYNISNEKMDTLIKPLVDYFELGHILPLKVKKISGGQLQKLQSILALMIEPKLLLLDELSNNLDYKSRKEILALFAKFMDKHGATLIIVTHNAEEIQHFCNKIAILKNKGIESFVEIGKDASVEDIERIISNTTNYNQQTGEVDDVKSLDFI